MHNDYLKFATDAQQSASPARRMAVALMVLARDAHRVSQLKRTRPSIRQAMLACAANAWLRAGVKPAVVADWVFQTVEGW